MSVTQTQLESWCCGLEKRHGSNLTPALSVFSVCVFSWLHFFPAASVSLQKKLVGDPEAVLRAGGQSRCGRKRVSCSRRQDGKYRGGGGLFFKDSFLEMGLESTFCENAESQRLPL